MLGEAAPKKVLQYAPVQVAQCVVTFAGLSGHFDQQAQLGPSTPTLEPDCWMTLLGGASPITSVRAATPEDRVFVLGCLATFFRKVARGRGMTMPDGTSPEWVLHYAPAKLSQDVVAFAGLSGHLAQPTHLGPRWLDDVARRGQPDNVIQSAPLRQKTGLCSRPFGHVFP